MKVEPEPDLDEVEPDPNGAEPQDPDDIILLEYLQRGCLQKAISAACVKGLRFPDRVLWLIFHCRKSFPPSAK